MIKQTIFIKKISQEDENCMEFREWEEHFICAGGNENYDIEVKRTKDHYFVYSGNTIVGILYLKERNNSLYFVFYSLKEFTRKGLGLGEQIITLVDSIARSQEYKNIGVLTAKICGVISYYRKKGFEIVKQSSEGHVWMRKKID
ncbi:MAG: GNAT family N-acetyltransferase [Candidatus Pacebacteria bacterium]|nr:GNAT family N-acetyltransferase [Candidatus Paceibacterota bacterium]